MDTSWDVVIVGGGAAGLMAAAAAAERGRRTLVLEKNKKLGVKILMSGGTRCNLTHHATPRQMADEFREAARFLYKSIGQFPPQAVIDTIEAEGVFTKVEENGKVFPISDRAIDIRDALVRRTERVGAVLLSGVAVQNITHDPALGFRCATSNGEYSGTSLILCTGGKSYPGCGTTGDGYAWAEAFGHTITPLHPALTPLLSSDNWVHDLSGITLPRVRVEAWGESSSRAEASRCGPLLFTHTGLSGPEPMNLSRFYTNPNSSEIKIMRVDFLPDISVEEWNSSVRNNQKNRSRSSIAARLEGELPQRLIDCLLSLAEVPRDRRLAELSGAELKRLTHVLKSCPVHISGTKGYDKAEVTAGGIALAEVNPSTMESRCFPGLFLAGEILNVDGPIGGFNFQAAFSTGTLAGKNA
ncbi:MAG: aminoacetone oxidase family FAD-binding enzyme [Pirellulaceae bacterium]|nr:aminoacetone oxidase family FAD-binding enzyme [Pirellulaceae bacterium]